MQAGEVEDLFRFVGLLRFVMMIFSQNRHVAVFDRSQDLDSL